MRRGLIGASLAALMATALIPTPASAVVLWTLTATPLTTTEGQLTTFTLTVTNLDVVHDIGCVEVEVSERFEIVSAAAGRSPASGDPWMSDVIGNIVVVHSRNGGGRLNTGQALTFTIQAVATDGGVWSWPNHAHTQQDCADQEEPGAPLVVTVLGDAPDPTPKPTVAPTPTPKPTPKPTAEPTATPEPSVTLPLPSVLPSLALPSLGPTSTPAPTGTSTPRPDGSTPDPTPTPAPTDAAAPLPSGSAGSAPPGASPSANAPRGAVGLVLGGTSGDTTGPAPVPDFELGPLGLVDGFTTWAIPGAAVGGPGLLVILWVVVQTGVAAAWMPAVERLRGRDRRGRTNRFAGAG